MPRLRTHLAILAVCLAAASNARAQTASDVRSVKGPAVSSTVLVAPPATTPPPAPDSKAPAPSGVDKASPQWPKILPQSEPPPLINGWKKEDVDLARAQCAAVLAKIAAVTTPVDPLKDGECGAVAPVELSSIGTAPKVAIHPPAIVTCDMVVALDKWLKTDVQPAARSLLGAPINRIDVMSSYSCRMAYGRKRNKLSEHGRANALDIRALTTERGETVEILADWGMTERDIKAQIAAAKAEEQRKEVAAKRDAEIREAERAAAAAKSESAKTATAPKESTIGAYAAPHLLRGAIIDQNSNVAGGASVPSLAVAPRSRLGGPKEPPALSHTANPDKPKERFLRRIHASACQTFATSLGPESNDSHRNHFHVDLAERGSGKFCE